MQANDRQLQILDHLKKAKSARVADLAIMFQVSEMTIRRDLNTLAKAELIEHQHGKAVLIEQEELFGTFSERSDVYKKEKQFIAQRTLPLLQSANSLFIDGSSTAFEVIPLLPSKRTFTIYTNSFAAFSKMYNMPNINAFLMGGFLCPDGNTLDDVSTLQTAHNINVDLAIFSCYGFSNDGIFNNDQYGVEVKRIIIMNAFSSVLMADSSKAFTRGIFRFATWDYISYLITDRTLPADFKEMLLKYNTQVIDK